MSLTAAKERIAAHCTAVLADPEAKIGLLGELLDLADSRASPTAEGIRAEAAALAQLSLVAVFKDIVPAYRIRPPTDEELAVKVSKEVAQLRKYEQALLQCYQSFLKLLLAEVQRAESLARRGEGGGGQRGGAPQPWRAWVPSWAPCRTSTFGRTC